MTSVICAGVSTSRSQREASRVCLSQPINDPGPPVTSGMSGAAVLESSAALPPTASLRLTSVTAPHPAAARVANDAKRPMVRWSAASPPRIAAAARDRPALSLDSP